jgi:hypothetical protein
MLALEPACFKLTGELRDDVPPAGGSRLPQRIRERLFYAPVRAFCSWPRRDLCPRTYVISRMFSRTRDDVIRRNISNLRRFKSYPRN